MRLIFSKDRPAQLDLLLQSLERHAEPESAHVIWLASTVGYWQGYQELGLADESTPLDLFDDALRGVLEHAGETTTLFCDDDVVYRRPPYDPRELLLSNGDLLTVSLRLGAGNRQQAIPAGFPTWEWAPLERTDFGFPGSIDGHCFRTADLIAMIGSDVIPNPTMLETILAHRVDVPGRPLMTCYEDQCLVGVPVNRVSDQSGVPHGLRFPQPPAELNDRFLAGERIDLDALDFSGVDACHREIEYVWRKS